MSISDYLIDSALVLPGSAAGSDLSATGGGYGLRGMRERAEVLDGTLEAGTLENHGWRVRLRIPSPAPSGPRDEAAVMSQ
jgi:glucose-6-phosphate-specific signal transduction histidine kinase